MAEEVRTRNTVKRGILAGISTNVLVLGVVSLLTDMSSEMIYPVMPLFLSFIGATGLVIGLIEGASETTASLLKVVSGWYSDKYDKRKPFITSGYGLSSLIKPALIWATAPVHVLGIKIAERVGKGIRSAPRDALIADSTAANVRGRAFGFHKAMDSLGAVIGPIITLAIILFVALSEMGTYRLIFTIAVIPALAGVVVIVFFVKEKEKSSKRSERTFRKGMKELEMPFWLLMVVVLVFYVGEISYAFFILKAQVVEEDLVRTIGLYVLFNVTFVLVSIPAGNLSDRMGRKPVIMAAFSLFALTCVLMATAESLILLLLGFALFGVYKGASEGVLKAYVTDIVPSDLRGTALGVFHTAVGLVMLPGGIVAGLLWDEWGPWATFTYGATMALVAMGILMMAVRSDRPRITQTA